MPDHKPFFSSAPACVFPFGCCIRSSLRHMTCSSRCPAFRTEFSAERYLIPAVFAKCRPAILRFFFLMCSVKCVHFSSLLLFRLEMVSILDFLSAFLSCQSEASFLFLYFHFPHTAPFSVINPAIHFFICAYLYIIVLSF